MPMSAWDCYIILQSHKEDHFRLNSAIGMYNQFVAKNMIIDTSGNYQFTWTLCDNDNIPVLNSESITLGFSYNKNDLTVSIEGYLKRTGGITRFLETGEGTILYEGAG